MCICFVDGVRGFPLLARGTGVVPAFACMTFGPAYLTWGCNSLLLGDHALLAVVATSLPHLSSPYRLEPTCFLLLDLLCNLQ